VVFFISDNFVLIYIFNKGSDFIFHNLIWRFGEIHLIDPDYMSYDLPCIDLGKFLRRNMLNSDWSLNGAENILTGYSGISPLGKEEMQLLYILLSLPYKYWQSIYLFLTGKPGHTYRRTLKTVEQLVDQIPRKALFLEQFAAQFL
jgi:thiamine kinase-like enzyme